jgi:TonB family protein
LEEEIPLEKRALEKMLAVPNQFSYSTELPSLNRKTQLIFSKNLHDRLSQKLSSWPSPSINLLNESQVGTLRIGISPEGFVLHSLVEESSGSSPVDQLALAEIRKTVFQPRAQQTIEWGTVTIYWTFNNPSKKGTEGP